MKAQVFLIGTWVSETVPRMRGSITSAHSPNSYSLSRDIARDKKRSPPVNRNDERINLFYKVSGHILLGYFWMYGPIGIVSRTGKHAEQN